MTFKLTLVRRLW